MDKDLESACIALETLAKSIAEGWGSDATMTDGIGWFAPTLSRVELAGAARLLASDIRSTGITDLDEATRTFVVDIPRRTEILRSTTVPQFWSSNAGAAVPAYTFTMTYIRARLMPVLGWQAMPDPKALPANLARRARAALADLDNLTPDIEALSQKVSDIHSAHAVSENLTVDLADLAIAREKLGKATTDSALLSEKVREAHIESEAELKKMKLAYIEAKKLVDLCETAYQITTTKGLAGAFDQRASKLSASMWTWVFGLVAALAIGSLIGAGRLDQLSLALNNPAPNMSSVGVQALLSILSIGAPLWFAWLSTKQIGQRFRLSEDYAFKASVAKAYEGYRKEAARIDPKFEAQLFSSALTRLDEAPLRLVETTSHGSPWHELANSDDVRALFRKVPELQDQVSALLRQGLATVGKAVGKNADSQPVSQVQAPTV